MKRIAFFGLALSCSASMLACATVDDAEVIIPKDSGGGDSSTGDALPDTGSDATDTGKSDTTPETPEKCTPPLTDKRACGMCGTQTRSCTASGSWGAWGACGDEISGAECSIGEKRTTECGNCGKQNDTCDNTTCTWNTGTCTGEGECAEGEIKTSTASCTVAGEVRTLVCSKTCKYPDVLSVPCAAPKGWVSMAAPPTGIDARFKHSAVWTGTEMIIWGGYGTYVSPSYSKKNGASYNVLADTWKLIDSTSLPTALSTGYGRYDHSAVWTGSAMVVWGGYDYYTSTYKADGGSYDPATDKWKAINGGPLAARSQVQAVWSTTTNEMIIWGGYSSICSSSTYACSDGAAYDPAKDTWRLLPAAPISGRWKATTVWTGTEMIIWGGASGSSQTYPSPVFRDGARFDPKTNVWTKFADPAIEIDGRVDHVGIWSGKDLLVYGGFGTYISPTYGKKTGSKYTPGGSWTSMTSPTDSDLTTPTRFASAAWFGLGKLWVWAGGNGSSSSGIAVAGGATYDPATDKWASMDVTDAPTARSRPSVIWTGKEAIIWGGSNYASGSTYYSDGKVYRP
ncbi:MAG: hypothetical protein JNL79_40195 [Myxococcales bacterium]|nr:hypothetical protein [Myxococcales bacterium]